ncbi:MAG: threonine--tRNA ligase [Deltaproteobacteria bacterium]|nr:threonine--tRNA ligase [Deltaproteobacteria bacterium]
MKVSLPGPKTVEAAPGTPVGQILADAGLGEPIAAKLAGRPVDLSAPLERDAALEPIFPDDSEGLEILRHSTSHVMAQAVKSLFPDARVAIGPAVASGFYYDFDVDTPFTPEDLPRIEKKMARIIKADLDFSCQRLLASEAIDKFKALGEPYKVELIEDLHLGPDEEVSVYTQGDFTDLCRGPHLASTGGVKTFRLTSVAGAYWRGDEKNKMLSRIYGTAFFNEEELAAHLANLEEAKRRDHRKLGRQLDLFRFHEEIGPGMVVWHPKGALLRTILEDNEKKWHFKRGYDLVIGPQLLKRELWEKSGHFDNYREHMYFCEIEGEAYGVKPMNCLAHMLIFKSKKRSYRALPQRYFELGVVHRHEKSGVLHGLARVRQFTQDDAHILCTPEQLGDEIKAILDLEADMMAVFGFDYHLELATRPEKSIGSDKDWELGISVLSQALEDKGLAYRLNEGDGAFYGPKIDLHLTDALGRSWQTGTIQCDFTLPERFDLEYIGPDGEGHRPVMLHRTILGSLERFIGVLIEHYGGAFPVWLAPTQAVVLSITDRVDDYCERINERLTEAEIRSELDLRNEKLGYKIREAQLQKIPYMLIVGDKETEAGLVAVRTRDREDLGQMELAAFIDRVENEALVSI